MMMEPPGRPRNLLSFLAAEHENELVSVHKHTRDLDVLAKIDGLYQAPVDHLDIPNGFGPVAQLYLFIHYHLYTTVSNLMRRHLSEAFSSERKAIDAALSAYEMLTNPASIPDYVAREWKFLTIKSFIDKARKKDATLYPLAEELIETWDMCSQYGAHADDSTFALRLEQVPVHDTPDQQKIFFLYFQDPPTEDEARWYFVDTFANFLSISRVFDGFIKDNAKGFTFDAWLKQRDELDGLVRQAWARLDAAIHPPAKGGAQKVASAGANPAPATDGQS